jgi:hypothetical protein
LFVQKSALLGHLSEVLSVQRISLESEEEESSRVAGYSSSLCSGDVEANVMPQRISSFSLSGHDVDLFRVSKRRLSFCIYNKGKQKENYDECRRVIVNVHFESKYVL